MKHNQTCQINKNHSLTPVKEKNRNNPFKTVALMKKRGSCYLKQKNNLQKKNSQYILTLTMEDVLGEQNFMHNDHKSLTETFEKSILEKLDSGRMVWTLGLWTL